MPLESASLAQPPERNHAYRKQWSGQVQKRTVTKLSMKMKQLSFLDRMPLSQASYSPGFPDIGGTCNVNVGISGSLIIRR